VRHIFKPISYLEIQLLSGVSGGYISALRNIGVIEIDDESHYLSFTLKHIERDNVEFIYSDF
ncbi:hypothetical protein ACOY7K_24060, partial [Enterobacter asburiae]